LAADFPASGLAALDLAVSDFAASDLAASDLVALDLAVSDLDASDLDDLDLEVSDLDLSDFDLSDLAVSDLTASGGVDVWAYAGNPMVSARPVATPTDKASDRLIDNAVDRKAAARADWVTAFLRGESSIPSGNTCICLNMWTKY
jgi:uncharacterized protein YjbI with pentapeptide repeats